MNSRRLSWGLLVVAIGILLLGQNLDWWSGIAWNRLWELWPLLFIVIGLRMVVKSNGLFLLAMVAIIAVGSLMLVDNVIETRTTHSSMHWNFGKNFHLSGETARFTESVPAAAENVIIDLSGHYDIIIAGDPLATAVTTDLTGPKEVIDNLRLVKEGTTIKLSERDSNFGFFAVTNYQTVTGTITMPASPLQLDLSGLSRVTVAGAIDQLTVKGSGAVTVEATASPVVDPIIDLSGAGTVTLGQCEGIASFHLSGAGKIIADNCTLDSLTARMSGAGEIEIKNGTIRDADLKTSGAAKIKIPRPSGSVKQDNTGASTIQLSTGV
jgi:hypothetical protein